MIHGLLLGWEGRGALGGVFWWEGWEGGVRENGSGKGLEKKKNGRGFMLFDWERKLLFVIGIISIFYE